MAALGASACGSAGRRTPHRLLPRALPPVGARTRRPVLTPLTRLQAALGRAMYAAGAGSGALVYDITAGSQLFALRDAVKRPPASVEKLYTTVAVLDKLGPDARLQTQILGAGSPGSRGAWDGDLYLRGGGDPTLGDGTFNRDFEGGYGPTAAQLVAQLRARGIRRVTGHVIADESLFDSRRGGPATGYAPDVPDFGGQLSALTYDHGAATARLSPAAFAARELALTMRGQHIRARAARTTAHAPPGAVPLAAVSSPPMSELLKLMDVPSDDLFAEMLTKQLGARYVAQGTISGGASVIGAVAAIWGVHPAIIDGSGLSRADRSSPAEVVALLRALAGTPTGSQLQAALPVVGVSGTVARIGVGTPAQGNCVAKTGTLEDVTNLAGYCRGRDRHLIAFALFLDGPENSRGLELISRIVAAIAAY